MIMRSPVEGGALVQTRRRRRGGCDLADRRHAGRVGNPALRREHPAHRNPAGRADGDPRMRVVTGRPQQTTESGVASRPARHPGGTPSAYLGAPGRGRRIPAGRCTGRRAPRLGGSRPQTGCGGEPGGRAARGWPALLSDGPSPTRSGFQPNCADGATPSTLDRGSRREPRSQASGVGESGPMSLSPRRRRRQRHPRSSATRCRECRMDGSETETTRSPRIARTRSPDGRRTGRSD